MRKTRRTLGLFFVCTENIKFVSSTIKSAQRSNSITLDTAQCITNNGHTYRILIPSRQHYTRNGHTENVPPLLSKITLTQYCQRVALLELSSRHKSESEHENDKQNQQCPPLSEHQQPVLVSFTRQGSPSVQHGASSAIQQMRARAPEPSTIFTGVFSVSHELLDWILSENKQARTGPLCEPGGAVYRDRTPSYSVGSLANCVQCDIQELHKANSQNLCNGGSIHADARSAQGSAPVCSSQYRLLI